MPLGAKDGPTLVSHVLHRLIYGKHSQSSCLKPQGMHRALIFGMYNHLVDIYQVV